MVPALRAQFHYSQEVSNLVVSLFVAGYCVGPLIWAPLSEQYGRRPLFIVTFFVYAVRPMPFPACRVIHRFISASKWHVLCQIMLPRCWCSASSEAHLQLVPLPTLGRQILLFCFLILLNHSCSAVLADIWDPKTLGAASAIFAVAPIAGPGVGPVVAGYLAQGGVSWRWLFWILTIFVSMVLGQPVHHRLITR